MTRELITMWVGHIILWLGIITFVLTALNFWNSGVSVARTVAQLVFIGLTTFV